MEELFIKNGKIVPIPEWKSIMDNLRLKVQEQASLLNLNKKEMITKLSLAITKAVRTRIPNKEFGVFFSGGVDSSMIALILKKINADFTCYCVGFEGAADIEAAKEVAEHHNLPLKIKTITLGEADKLVKEAVELYNSHDVVIISVACVLIAAARFAKQDGITYFFSGLGSEEIFGGYERHEQAKDVNEECWNGLYNMYDKDLLRDYTAAKHLGIEISTPFLDKELIIASMSIPGEYKIRDGNKKIILREAAESIGLMKKAAWRKKSAAQYGSSFDRALHIIARKNGFGRFKKRYLGSLVGERKNYISK